MPVKQCILFGQSIGSLDDLYDELTRQLSLPKCFGRNLDALWDALTTDVRGPVELVWKDSAISQAVMGRDFDKISALLEEVERTRVDFAVFFR